MLKMFHEIGHWWKFHKTFFGIIYTTNGITLVKTKGTMLMAV